MAKKSVFKGVATAIVTPLNANGVDYEAFGRLIDWQIECGVPALVIAGTTGEGSTLTEDEHRKVISFSVERAAGKTVIIAGTGSNNTAHAIEMTKFAGEAGADAVLVVSPYYNKTTQKGLIKMYTEIADASEKPLILYNIPSRTGINIEPSTFLALADHPMIAGIKEANGNISKIVETAALVGDKLSIYSGNDDQIIPLLSVGGSGVISVLSNIMPRETVAMCDKFFAGDVEGAAGMQLELLPLIKALFCETNPIPVKAATAAMGYGENYLRLPLVPMEPEHEAMLLKTMKGYGLI